MAARQMRWVLALELLGYLLLGHWLGQHDWSWSERLALAVGVFLTIRIVIVAVSYGFYWADSRLIPSEQRAAPLRMLRMMLEELAGLVLIFVFIQPFERFWLGVDRLGSSTKGRLPLLLIHGYQCNRGFWFWLRPRLEAMGWVVATHNLEPVLADIDSYADGVERRIDEVLAATGAGQVILVGHSMGGLVSRAYLRRFGKGKVSRMISLGSPHHGSHLADLAWGPNGKQMKRGNPWLAELAKPAAVPLPAGSVSIYSLNDNQVMPQRQCSRLEDAINVEISGVSHLGMAFSPLLLATLLRTLEMNTAHDLTEGHLVG